MKESSFYSRGKLLLAGEYFVLDGAQSFAVPTKLGQSLSITPSLEKASTVTWTSVDEKGETWFEGKFDLKNLDAISVSDDEIGNDLGKILKRIQQANVDLFAHPISIKTSLEFNRNWGLGTSSTLINNLSQWSGLDPYLLLAESFGGSGYDLACANAEGPIFYHKNEEGAQVSKGHLSNSFLNNLWLVYLGKKQNSREGIAAYRAQGTPEPALLRQISQLSMMLGKSADLATFCSCIQELERITGDYLGLTPIQETLFKAMPGAAKSLGAWGGDFALLATPWTEQKVKAYCENLGLNEVFAFTELVKLY